MLLDDLGFDLTYQGNSDSFFRYSFTAILWLCWVHHVRPLPKIVFWVEVDVARHVFHVSIFCVSMFVHSLFFFSVFTPVFCYVWHHFIFVHHLVLRMQVFRYGIDITRHHLKGVYVVALGKARSAMAATAALWTAPCPCATIMAQLCFKTIGSQLRLQVWDQDLFCLVSCHALLKWFVIYKYLTLVHFLFPSFFFQVQVLHRWSATFFAMAADVSMSALWWLYGLVFFSQFKPSEPFLVDYLIHATWWDEKG